VFNGCKKNNALIISKDVRVKARREKTLVAHRNSLAHPKANSIPTNVGEGRGGDRAKMKIKQS
jgi:hypothetical protein